jgi:hypothetical protein
MKPDTQSPSASQDVLHFVPEQIRDFSHLTGITVGHFPAWHVLSATDMLVAVHFAALQLVVG